MPKYNVVNGTSYHVETTAAVIQVLECAMKDQTRIHISFGDVSSGLDRLEEYDIKGYVGRSTGSVKVPLLIANRRSLGGGSILDHCIVRIRRSSGGRVLYQHQSYNFGTLVIRHKVEPVVLRNRILTIDVLQDGKTLASFESMDKATRFIHRLGVTARVDGQTI